MEISVQFVAVNSSKSDAQFGYLYYPANQHIYITQ